MKELDNELFFSICEKYFCHYHIDDKDKLVICGSTQKPIASTFSWFNEQTCEYKYCPYCGKEICFK